MLIYNKSVEELENEKVIKEFYAGIQANRIREDIEGVDTKTELKIQYKLLYKFLFTISVLTNLIIFFN